MGTEWTKEQTELNALTDGSGLRMVAPLRTLGIIASADIQPAHSRWLPVRGRTSRWWFEISTHNPDDLFPSCWDYDRRITKRGGAFTLRGAIREVWKAFDALDELPATEFAPHEFPPL